MHQDSERRRKFELLQLAHLAVPLELDPVEGAWVHVWCNMGIGILKGQLFQLFDALCGQRMDLRHDFVLASLVQRRPGFTKISADVEAKFVKVDRAITIVID